MTLVATGIRNGTPCWIRCSEPVRDDVRNDMTDEGNRNHQAREADVLALDAGPVRRMAA